MYIYEKEPIVIQDLKVLGVSKGYYLFICVSVNHSITHLITYYNDHTI